MNDQNLIDDKGRTITVVQEGKNSEYWVVLKKAVIDWKNAEIRYMDQFKATGINEGNFKDYNRAVDRVTYLNRFLNINETIIDKNRTILEKLKAGMSETYKKAESFVNATFK